MKDVINYAKDFFTKKVFYIDPCHDSELLLSDKTICDSIEKFAKERHQDCQLLSKTAPIHFVLDGKTYLAASDGLLSQIAALTPLPIIACQEL